MKYTKEQLEAMGPVQLRSAARSAGINLREVMNLGHDGLVEEILKRDGCDHDCDNCDHQHLVAQMPPYLTQSTTIPRTLRMIKADSLEDLAQKIQSIQKQALTPQQMMAIVEQFVHPKLKCSPFWRVDLAEVGESFSIKLVFVVDPIILEAASLTVRGLQSFVKKEFDKIRPALPAGLVVKLEVKKEIKQVLGAVRPRPREE